MKNLFQFQTDVQLASEPPGTVSSPVQLRDFESKLDLSAILGEEVHLKPETRLAFYTDPRSCTADRYRYLRMRLREARQGSKLKTLLVTSPLPGDGKSTTSVNLASALADGGKSKVLLLEADLYHSPLIEMVGLEPGPGLAECLESSFDIRAAIRRLEPLGWYLLPAGKAESNPTELLHTEAFSRIIDAVVGCFDWVLIDSPPVLPLVDALILKRHANATLLITRSSHTPRVAIEKSLALIGHEHVFGVILNALPSLNKVYSKYSAYYNGSGAKRN